ncbi:hypothetical protein HPP92_018188 [Vanilla planifolia]|uniref:Uncharacterized protein n=1 Tax=Vanilla planifolia TaxID=51239 RepID=A0A835Q9C3_VANPL|nr:hypothetical protein HPP92_018188 [Vanilla planifolia]
MRQILLSKKRGSKPSKKQETAGAWLEQLSPAPPACSSTWRTWGAGCDQLRASRFPLSSTPLPACFRHG